MTISQPSIFVWTNQRTRHFDTIRAVFQDKWFVHCNLANGQIYLQESFVRYITMPHGTSKLGTRSNSISPIPPVTGSWFPSALSFGRLHPERFGRLDLFVDLSSNFPVLVWIFVWCVRCRTSQAQPFPNPKDARLRVRVFCLLALIQITSRLATRQDPSPSRMAGRIYTHSAPPPAGSAPAARPATWRA